ncbi:thiamine pyrophosphate-binding protein [Limnohabitans sp.]|jgi:3D-(3,5/4)-trihydroxycyclohexane-1,2-dione acylhydrolase (decyclizing)|uniref:thiamine pyrophosphate-binding protein n=1 Tax=Limnohabitans sp. TaxID=1907725 RepID=UPI002AFF333F|nr:thiamine pyrophosphate-dependent enzyme [Limnohabitans sp.]
MNKTVDLPTIMMLGTQGEKARAQAIVRCGGLQQALDSGELPNQLNLTLSEALVLGLLKQGVCKYLAIFGHGSTDLGEVLRVYTEAGVTQVFNFRNEVEMAHAGTALAWAWREPCAVVTSIGPGALQAMSGSLAAACNGVGLYHIYGDETTWGEGYNMQQIPKPQQQLYGQMTALMGQSYVLHTPEALRDALRRGTQCVHHPVKAGPFFLLLPINTQPQVIHDLQLKSLPEALQAPRTAVADKGLLKQAAQELRQHARIVIKVGGGGRAFAGQLRELAERCGAAVVVSPGSTGVLPDSHPQYMHVGGSKGSISGNHAMSHATLLLAIGTRAVCQSDCSGVGYPLVEQVININGDLADLAHYNRTLALQGDIGAVVAQLVAALEDVPDEQSKARAAWLDSCNISKSAWKAFLRDRQSTPPLLDEVWQRPVLTQPAAIKIVCDFAREVKAIKFFDAGDVQANGFQTVEDDSPWQTYTESGASYMGFATCAVTAAGMASTLQYPIAFTGDGSFMMNPQSLISAVEHGARGTIVVFDNRRMAAISSLQHAQYGQDFRTNDGIAVDYVQMASSVKGVLAVWGGEDSASLQHALQLAHAHDGLALIHVPVYAGERPEGGLGAYGSWNVGNWCDDVQRRYLATLV